MDLVTRAATLIGYTIMAALLLVSVVELAFHLRYVLQARRELQGKVALLEVDNRNLQARSRALDALAEELLVRDRELIGFVRQLADHGFRHELEQLEPDAEVLARIGAKLRAKANECLERARSPRGAQDTPLAPVIERLAVEAEQVLAAPETAQPAPDQASA